MKKVIIGLVFVSLFSMAFGCNAYSKNQTSMHVPYPEPIENPPDIPPYFPPIPPGGPSTPK